MKKERLAELRNHFFPEKSNLDSMFHECLNEIESLRSQLDAIAAECKLHPKQLWVNNPDSSDCDCIECRLKRRIMAILGSNPEKRYVNVDDFNAACDEMNRKAHWVHSLVTPTLKALDDIWENGKLYGGAGEAYGKCQEKQFTARVAH